MSFRAPVQMAGKSTDSVSNKSFTPTARGILQRKCSCGGTSGPTGECERCRKQRIAAETNRNTAANGAPAIVHDVLRSPGQPLDSKTRALMEPRFDYDFSR